MARYTQDRRPLRRYELGRKDTVRRPPKYSSRLPHSDVGVYAGVSAMYQFKGVARETQAGRMGWYQNEDGALVANQISPGRDGQPASSSLLIDRDQRVMTFTQRESSGAVVISRNIARSIEGEPMGMGRALGDVEASFDELVTIALDHLAVQTDAPTLDGPDVEHVADIDH